MDIHQIQYLITIVDTDFNLTKSAKQLNVSQPTLSKLIREVEATESIQIFVHKKGRIVDLTPAGEDLIRRGRQISSEYEALLQSLHDHANIQSGKIRIGIAPVIISTVFNKAIPVFIQENPAIELKIVEKGAYELQKMLLLQEIDLAVLVSPSTFPTIKETIIYRNTVSVWFNKQHRFHELNGPIPLEEVDKERIVTLDDSFMVTYQVKQKLKNAGLSTKFFLQTSAWDLILNMCQEMDTIGIVATPIGNNYAGNQTIEHRDFEPLFPWNISICHIGERYPSSLVKYVERWFIDYFDSLSHNL